MDEERTMLVPLRAVVAMLVTVGAELAILGALAPVLPLYVEQVGATPAQWGLMAAAGGFLLIFSEPTWGWIADRLGYRNPYLVARVAIAAGLWAMYFFPSLALILVWQLVVGIFESTLGVLCRGYLMRAFKPGREPIGMTLYLIVYSLSLAAGSMAGGVLFRDKRPGPVLLLVAVLGTLAVVASILVSDPPRAGAEPSRQAGMAGAPVRKALNQATVILGMVGLLQFVANRLVRNFLVLLARDRAGLDATAVGVLLGVFSLANVLFLLVLQRLDRRLGLAWRIVLGLAMGAVALLCYSLARGFGALLLAVTIDALGWALASPARVVLVGRLSPPGLYGWALGLHGSFENVGVLVGPLMGGLLWGLAGPAAPYQVGAMLLVVGAAVAVRLRVPLTRTETQPG
jgi:MFS family permease